MCVNSECQVSRQVNIHTASQPSIAKLPKTFARTSQANSQGTPQHIMRTLATTREPTDSMPTHPMQTGPMQKQAHMLPSLSMRPDLRMRSTISSSALLEGAHTSTCALGPESCAHARGVGVGGRDLVHQAVLACVL